MSGFTWKQVGDGSWLETCRHVWLMHESYIGFGLRWFHYGVDGIV